MENLEFYYGNVYVCTDNAKIETKPTIVEDCSVYPFCDKINVMMNIYNFNNKYEVHKSGLLLKIKEGIYIDVEDISNLSDLNKISINPDSFLSEFKNNGKRIITTIPVFYGNLFVKEQELVFVPCSITKRHIFEKVKK